jgi:chitodextrinase
LVVLASAVCLLAAGCGWTDDEDSKPPTAPSGVTADASSSTSVHVMWRRSTDNTGVTGYEVYRGGKKVAQVPGGALMVDVTGLKPATDYRFTVLARDKAGNRSARSKEVPVTTLPESSNDRKAPTTPGSPRATADGERGATLTWGRSTDNNGVTSYDIYQGDTKIHSVGGDETTARITWLRPGTSYTFTVKARDSADNVSPASRPVGVTTAGEPEDGAGTAPGGFEVTPVAESGASYLKLAWTTPEVDGEVTEYQIYFNGEFATTLMWGSQAPAGKATYKLPVHNAKPGTVYTVKMRAKLPDGEWGGFSAQRTVTLR